MSDILKYAKRPVAGSEADGYRRNGKIRVEQRVAHTATALSRCAGKTDVANGAAGWAIRGVIKETVAESQPPIHV